MDSTTIELIGWIGNMMLALCAIPQALASYRQKHSHGLTWSFLLMWGGGEVLAFVYGLTVNIATPVIVNYVINLAAMSVIIWYRLFPQRGKDAV